MLWSRPISLVNGRVVTPSGIVGSIRFSHRIMALGDPARRGDVVLDVKGAWVLPGLVNPHDHLELNHYGLQTGRGAYRNVREWIADMRPRLGVDPALVEGRRRPLAARIFAGGLKNLLSGVTLVAHHNPVYPGMRRTSPVPILRRFGWAHSLDMEHAPVGALGESGGVVSRRFLETPRDAPFIVHAAEGLDADAAGEIVALDRAGVLGPRTVLVHALGAEAGQERLLSSRQVGLVWCPASNLALFGRTWTWTSARAAFGDRIGLGTDSRLTGSRDLFDELRLAQAHGGLTPEECVSLVTSWPARLLRCATAGHLVTGALADVIVLPADGDSAGEALVAAQRSDLQLVMTGGRPRVGSEAFRSVFLGRGVIPGELTIDGRRRLVDAAVVRALGDYGIPSEGVRFSRATA